MYVRLPPISASPIINCAGLIVLNSSDQQQPLFFFHFDLIANIKAEVFEPFSLQSDQRYIVVFLVIVVDGKSSFVFFCINFFRHLFYPPIFRLPFYPIETEKPDSNLLLGEFKKRMQVLLDLHTRLLLVILRILKRGNE